MRGIVKAFRRRKGVHCRFARATGGGVPRGLRCPAPPRHARLAENLGKPSLWVFIKETQHLLRLYFQLVRCSQGNFRHQLDTEK